MMREDNLLAIGRRKYVLTTDSRHPLKVYVNLAARMQLTGVNQLLDSGHHLYSAGRRVRLSGGGH